MRNQTGRACVAGLLGLFAAGQAAADAVDPLERVNRAVFEFNDTIDRNLLRPVAQSYRDHLPDWTRRGIGNFFGNLREPIVIVNDLLQAKFEQAASDLARFIFNSTFGLFGLLDVATPMGHLRHDEDLGQTLGVWGLSPGAYLVLPLIGPSTARDALGLAGDLQLDAVYYIDDGWTRAGVGALRAVHTRSVLLSASRVLEASALDVYLFTRESYLQRREARVYDGNPPAPDFEQDFEDAENADDTPPPPEPAP